MKTTSKILMLLIVSTTLLISCGKKEDKFPLTGRWVVVDAMITDDYFTKDMVLGNYYAFTETQMVYKGSQFTSDSAMYDLTYLDKATIQTYNKAYDMKTVYTFEFKKEDKKKTLILKSTNGFTYHMRKI